MRSTTAAWKSAVTPTAAVRPVGKVASGMLLWLLLVGSKFAVLELVALVFGDQVSLGGFWAVTGLILALLFARAGVRRLLDPPAAGTTPPGPPAG